jgi:hypothetical protein
MKKRLLLVVLVVAVLLPALSGTASADMGPKPSVVVYFKGLEQEHYYVTLLSDKESTGPWSKSDTFKPWYENKEIWKKLNAYEDTDGFYFLGCFSDCSETDTFKWTYYPPYTFKILIYFPEYDRFVVSADAYERYAFDSYYTVDATNVDIRSVSAIGDDLSVTRTYDITWQLVSLLCRIVGTIALELGVAWLFGYRRKKHLLIIGLTNIVTQTLLNVLLNVINYKQGALAFVVHFIWMELLVFIIEGLVYRRLLKRSDTQTERKTRPWLYALTANALSFAAGLLIAKWLPGIF